MEKKFKVGSLYAGVGGICLGFKNLGFDIEWANEYDKNACITYRKNFNHKLIEGDIMEINISELSGIDVLAGGFPCQPFSVAGYRKGFDDSRGNHFFRMLDFVDEMRPKVLFFENVKNLVGHDKGNTFKIIKNEIEQRNYSFQSKVLNTKDYGNIPHNRERIFVIAFDKNMYPNAEDLFCFPEKEKLTNKIENVIINTLVDDTFYYGENKSMYNKLCDSVTKKNTIYQYRRHYVRENKSNVCPTLTANMGTGGHNVPLIITDYGIRKLIPRECFRLQGFPDSFVLPKVSNSHLYKQSGNSVSVPVIEKLAKNIHIVLNGGMCPREIQLLF
jgi:DNA (cytosine-5)-methyltransferase 1